MTLTREICKRCGAESAVGFSVPDDMWLMVQSRFGSPNVLCVRCFTGEADRLRLAWDTVIEFWPVSLVTLEER